MDKCFKAVENEESNPGQKNNHFQIFDHVENCLLDIFNYFLQYIIKEIQRNQENFTWRHTRPKIQHNILKMNYKNGGLKNVDIFFEIAGLFYESFYEWKIMQLQFIETLVFYRKSFKFYSNLDFKNNILNYFPSYHHEVFANWKSLFSAPSIVISFILNQCLLFNRYKKIDINVVFS